MTPGFSRTGPGWGCVPIVIAQMYRLAHGICECWTRADPIYRSLDAQNGFGVPKSAPAAASSVELGQVACDGELAGAFAGGFRRLRRAR